MTESSNIELAPGAADNGLACMLAELLRENVGKRPSAARDLRCMNGRVALVARDAGVSVTLDFADGRVTLHDGIGTTSQIVVETDSEGIADLSNIPVRFGVPDFVSGAVGRQSLRALATGRLKLSGAWRHPLLLVRLTRLLSVAG